MVRRGPACWWRPRRGRVEVAQFVFALLTLVFPAQILHAADDVNSTSRNAIASALEYQETDYNVANWTVALTTRTPPFKSEPAATGKVVRGSLNIAGDAANTLCFVWQRDAGKLFLDLNRNQDLTDDSGGVFSTQSAKSEHYQSFTKVRLPLRTDWGRCQVLADVNLWDYSSRPGCMLSVRSFWHGRVTLHGQDWQIGIVPATWAGKNAKKSISFEDGQMLLRPWSQHNESFNAFNGSLAVVPFTRKLFVGGHAYQLDCVTKVQGAEVEPAMQFTEEKVELGALEITGKYIQRLVLSGRPYLVVLDQPAGTVNVPVGDYDQADVRLEHGGTEAFSEARHRPTNQGISVDPKTPAILAVGGPLTNSVLISRHGQELRMDYRLVGASGMFYQMADQNRSHPPEFAIYKGDKRIASGKFEFG